MRFFIFPPLLSVVTDNPKVDQTALCTPVLQQGHARGDYLLLPMGGRLKKDGLKSSLLAADFFNNLVAVIPITSTT
jgi:hypothetical protein